MIEKSTYYILMSIYKIEDYDVEVRCSEIKCYILFWWGSFLAEGGAIRACDLGSGMLNVEPTVSLWLSYIYSGTVGGGRGVGEKECVLGGGRSQLIVVESNDDDDDVFCVPRRSR